VVVPGSRVLRAASPGHGPGSSPLHWLLPHPPCAARVKTAPSRTRPQHSPLTIARRVTDPARARPTGSERIRDARCASGAPGHGPTAAFFAHDCPPGHGPGSSPPHWLCAHRPCAARVKTARSRTRLQHPPVTIARPTGSERIRDARCESRAPGHGREWGVRS
jgi:hypothetical protein